MNAMENAIKLHVARYAAPDDRAAWGHLFGALVLYVAGLALAQASAFFALRVAGGALVCGAFLKLFMIHHDLMHGCFFRSRLRNDRAAVLVGALCHVAPSVWKREHDRHHRTSNNLDEPQDGQTAPWTLGEYAQKPRWLRLAYRVAMQPLLLYGVGPLLYFFVFMRLRAKPRENLAQAAVWIGLYFAGAHPVHLLAFIPAATLGFVVFHAQHTFDGAYRRRAADWRAFDNAMTGSSLLVLPRWPLLGPFLRYCAHGVEFHHAHHLHPGIPGYLLARCHRDAGPLFAQVPRVTLGQAFSTLHYALYDEALGVFIRA